MEHRSSSFDIDKWKRKRRSTYITYLLQILLDGVYTSAIATTLWIYLKTDVVCSNKKLWYGLICGIFNISPIVFGVFISRWVDKTRNAKQCIILCNAVCAIGSALFILPFSPYFLIVGRFLNGTVLSLRPVMTAEVCRSYHSDELQKKLPFLMAFKAAGYAFGPLITFFFINVDVWIGKLHLSYGNSSCVLLLAMTLFQILITAIFSHNLSKEYDLKALNFGKEVVEKNCKPNDDSNVLVNNSMSNDMYEDEKDSLLCDQKNEESSLQVIKKLLYNIDAALVIILSIVAYFWQQLLTWATPSLILDIMHYTKNINSCFYFANAAMTCAMLFILASVAMTDKRIYYLGVTTFAVLLLSGLSVTFIFQYPDNNAVKITCLSVFCFGLAYTDIGEQVFLPVSFAKMLRSKNQGICEGFRLMVRRIGGLVGSFVSLYVLAYLKYSFYVLVVTVCLPLCCLVFRRQSFFNPHPFI